MNLTAEPLPLYDNMSSENECSDDTQLIYDIENNTKSPPPYDSIQINNTQPTNVRTHTINNPVNIAKFILTLMLGIIVFCFAIGNIFFFIFVCNKYNNTDTTQIIYSMFEIASSFLENINIEFLIFFLTDKIKINFNSKIPFTILLVANTLSFGTGLYYIIDSVSETTIFLNKENTIIFAIIFVQISIMVGILFKCIQVYCK